MSDASGAVVSGATVTVIDVGTNEKRTAKSEANGSYRFVNLMPATYQIQIEAPSFKRNVRDGVVVQVDETTRMDVSLQVGSTSEVVEVTTEAPLIQTESGTLGTEIEGRVVEETPLNGRNTMNLIALAPGVVPQGSALGSTSMNQGNHTSSAGWGNYQIGGSIAGQGTIYVDGVPDNLPAGNPVAFVPTQDAIQEFKVSTSATSAEFGRFAGGVVEMSTKSGSNQWHGTAYEYLRNTVLNANTYLWNNTPGNAGKRQKFNQNQFGVGASGPIVKNKAFVMFSWERFDSRIGAVDSDGIPDAGMMSATDPSIPKKIVDPSATIPRLAGCIYPYNAQGDGRTHLNPACLDPAAQILKEYFPDLNQPQSASNPTQYYVGPALAANYVTPYVIGNDNQQYNVRGDVNLNAQNHLFSRYTYLHMQDIPANPMHSAHGFDTANASSANNAMQAVLGDTHTLNATTIADVRLSYTRFYSDNRQASAGTPEASALLTDLGAGWSDIASNATLKMLPHLSLGNGPNPSTPDQLYSFRAMGHYSQSWDNDYTLSGSVVKIVGAHALKFGGELRLLNQDQIGAEGPSGTVAPTSAKFTQDEWANFLLGLPDSNSVTTGIASGSINWYQGYYATDTWTATHKLTLNLGLRWELPGAVSEKHNNLTVLLPNYVDPGSGVRGIEALVHSPLWTIDTSEPALHHLLAPRLGAAYQINPNTVVRAGFAVEYLPPDLQGNYGVFPNGSFVNQQTTTASNTQSSANFTVADPFGTGSNAIPVQSPPGRSWLNNYNNTFLSVEGGQNLTGPVPTTTYPYMEQWNISLARQFAGAQSIEAAYNGALLLHILPSGGTLGIDQPGAAQIAEIKACDLGTNPAPECQSSTTQEPYERANFTPFPHFHNVTNENPYVATENYRSFQIRYLKRLGSGQIASSYTYSKSVGTADVTASSLDNGNDAAYQDYTNIAGERSLLSFNIRNRWVTNYVVDLPFGNGKKFLSNSNGFVDRVVGGWSVNGITTVASGQPIFVTWGKGNVITGDWNGGTLRPDVVPGCKKQVGGSAQQRLSKWFNTACFTTPGSEQASGADGYTFGNEPRVDNTLTAAGQANWDFAAQKNTRIRENSNLQFRVEFFNLFNRRQFAYPNYDASSPATFGTVTSDQQNNPREVQASLRFLF